MAAQTLGRPLSANAANQTVNVLIPGQLYGDRVNQVDLRVAKILRFGRTRTLVGFDLYNLFNANPGLTYNQTFGTALAAADVDPDAAVRALQRDGRLLDLRRTEVGESFSPPCADVDSTQDCTPTPFLFSPPEHAHIHGAGHGLVSRVAEVQIVGRGRTRAAGGTAASGRAPPRRNR